MLHLPIQSLEKRLPGATKAMCCGLIHFPAQPASQCVNVVGIPIKERSHGAFVGCGLHLQRHCRKLIG